MESFDFFVCIYHLVMHWFTSQWKKEQQKQMQTLSPLRLRLSVWRIVPSPLLLPRATCLWSALKTLSVPIQARIYRSYFLTFSFSCRVCRYFIFWGWIRFLCLAALQSAPVLLLLLDPLTVGCCRWLLVIASVLPFPTAHLKKKKKHNKKCCRSIGSNQENGTLWVRGCYALQALQSDVC